MRSKNQELMDKIVEILQTNVDNCPTMQQIADSLSISKACVWKYLTELKNKGLVTQNYKVTPPNSKNIDLDTNLIPLVGTIACGSPILAEENIESYLPIPTRFLGKGKFYILKANGESMVNAGINDGDYVIIKKQDFAEEGQIVVALIDDEATLKRYYIDKKKKQVILHPENDNMQDMYFDSIIIQGVAVKVLKDLI